MDITKRKVEQGGEGIFEMAMKILYINSVYGFGSTGVICKELNYEINRTGNNGIVAYGQKNYNDNCSYKFAYDFENNLHNIGSRLFGKQGYYSYFSTMRLLRFIKKFNPDIIHLHNLHGNYLNTNILLKFLAKSKKPVVITLHDCWNYTGKCAHYTDVSCSKWKTECFQCPQLKSYPPSIFFDFSKQLYLRKKELFNNINNLSIITVSKWLEKEVRQSFLTQKKIRTIYNWVDTDIFKYTRNTKLYKLLGLESDNFKVILISAGWHKDDLRYKNLIKLAELIKDSAEIIMIGSLNGINNLPLNVKHIQYVKQQEDLAALFSLADVYIHLSTEDTFGKVIAEAMSCGTPAIVFNSTACPELIGEHCGFVVEKNDFEGILYSIQKIKKKGKEFYKESCRNHVLKNFEKSENINKTIALYKEILHGN